MAKISINLLGWNHKHLLGQAIDAVSKQSYRDFELTYMDNASTDGSVDYVRQNYPQVRIVASPKNLGYAGGHNLFFSQAQTEFVMVLNPDAVLHPEFLAEAQRSFDDPKVASVTGKMLKPGSKVLDGTGITMSLARRFRERGQNEVDRGQYDDKREIFGVSGTAAIFRKSALERVKMPKEDGGFEFFDEDFFAYFEDADLAWRLKKAGFVARFAPAALVFHARKAGSSPGGYKKIISFIRHHRALLGNVKKWNWRNHLFCIIKNDSGIEFLAALPFILVRELAMFIFILIFETRTLSVVPGFFRLLPKMFVKRTYIKRMINKTL